MADLHGKGQVAGSSACLASKDQARHFLEVIQHAEQLSRLPSPFPLVCLSGSPQAAHNLLRESGCSASPNNKQQQRLLAPQWLLKDLGNAGLLPSRKNCNTLRTGMKKKDVGRMLSFQTMHTCFTFSLVANPACLGQKSAEPWVRAKGCHCLSPPQVTAPVSDPHCLGSDPWSYKSGVGLWYGLSTCLPLLCLSIQFPSKNENTGHFPSDSNCEKPLASSPDSKV